MLINPTNDRSMQPCRAPIVFGFYQKLPKNGTLCLLVCLQVFLAPQLPTNVQCVTDTGRVSHSGGRSHRCQSMSCHERKRQFFLFLLFVFEKFKYNLTNCFPLCTHAQIFVYICIFTLLLFAAKGPFSMASP